MTIIESVLDASTATWTAVCRRDQLEVGWGEAALVGGAQAAVFLVPDGRIFAVSNVDPKTGSAVMSRGIVGAKGGRPTIASPLHKDVYDLETGACLTKPGVLQLTTWWVREDDGVILIAPRPVLVAASHGTADEAGQQAVRGLVEAVRQARPDITVEQSFVDVQQPDVTETFAAVDQALPITVVPLLLSAGYHVNVDLRQAADDTDRTVSITGALGPDPRLAQVLLRRLLESGFDPGAESTDQVIMAAAGSSDDSAVADCRLTAELLSEAIGREVQPSFLAHAEPRVADAVTTARAANPRARIFVATYLLASGYFAGLAASAGADVTTAPLLSAEGPVPDELVQIVSELYDAPHIA